MKRYLELIDTLYRKDQDNTGTNIMHRQFTIDETNQIYQALFAAEKRLAQEVDSYALVLQTHAGF
ncbi:MAG: hypothetical protein JEY79_18665 [Pseudodesulfovibrio sp.]|nr:hypothetical protein [Pseudodesulfovibrio sp.]